jgi:pyruvate dehydrogenase E2 component (dihydrolipoamide acetyltransferase)
MATDILVPPLSQTMDSLVFVAWLKKVGDPVEKGEILYQVETDKATLDVESPASGVLMEILADPGSEVLVKSKIGVITSTEEKVAVQPLSSGSADQHENLQSRIFASPRARNLAKAEGISLNEVKATGPQAMIVERDVRAYLTTHQEKPAIVRATPLAKRVAEATGVDLGVVAQTHQGEVIRRADVEAVLAEKQAPTVQPTEVGMSGKGHPVALTTLRKTIVRRMQQSHQNTAPVTINREVDATELVNLRTSILKESSVEQIRPTYTDFIVMILARILPQHPNLNAHFNGELFEVFEEQNIGIAVDNDRGLVVPVIHNVAHKGLLLLATERSRLIERALAGTLTLEELSGGTFTLTNLGTLGVDGFTPIINPPEVAILGIGRIRSVPAVYEEQITIRQIMVLSLTFDHRVIDGAPAARFLQDVTQLIEKPNLIWL